MKSGWELTIKFINEKFDKKTDYEKNFQLIDLKNSVLYSEKTTISVYTLMLLHGQYLKRTERGHYTPIRRIPTSLKINTLGIFVKLNGLTRVEKDLLITRYWKINNIMKKISEKKRIN